MWEAIMTGTVSGVMTAVVFAIIVAGWQKARGKFIAKRQRQARHTVHGNHYHWVEECENFPSYNWADGKGGKKPCEICRISTLLMYDESSMYRLPWIHRFLKKPFPEGNGS